MNKYLLSILLLTIWYFFLSLFDDIGLSLILLIIPLLVLIVYILLKNNKIKNKYGLLFIIPIIFLSSTYFIFDNIFCYFFNILVIPILFPIMYVYTFKPTYGILDFIENILYIFIEPFQNFKNIFNLSIKKIFMKRKMMSNKGKQMIKDIFIICPIVLVVIILLASADMIFKNIFSIFFDILKTIKINDSFIDIIFSILGAIFFYFYLAATINYLLYQYDKKTVSSKCDIKVSLSTIKGLLVILNIIYLVFDIIQVRYLFFRRLDMNISYAEYARQGFFQLMFVSVINIIVILLSKASDNGKSKKDTLFINVMNIFLVLFTLIIIMSSFMRMYMYESAFGYTILRLLVYIVLVIEVILIIPTLIYIINPKFNIFRAYLIILISSYIIVNFINMDDIIARKNINLYYETNKIDIYYLENDYTDNILILIDFYKDVDDIEIKEELDNYFRNLRIDSDNFATYNISKRKAIKALNELGYFPQEKKILS